ncbi:hypothetical protein WMY93_024146 [Mugilogobius chulae]|uniref:Uncharacterized protein n=1 Tax=Mugilogobius chulae TaxID=88201 RepID=A0AAW0N676_9GOBI
MSTPGPIDAQQSSQVLQKWRAKHHYRVLFSGPEFENQRSAFLKSPTVQTEAEINRWDEPGQTGLKGIQAELFMTSKKSWPQTHPYLPPVSQGYHMPNTAGTQCPNTHADAFATRIHCGKSGFSDWNRRNVVLIVF